MSDSPLRVGIVAEGIADYHILLSAVRSVLDEERPIIPALLQPEESVAFSGGGDAGPLGGGWKGVGKWCLQAARRGGGSLSGGIWAFDVLILHLDADIAANESDPGSGLLGLPCDKPCPPANATTDGLRQVMLRWIGENNVPDRVVLCTPSKSTDSWVMEAFFPADKEMLRLGKECHPSPESRLSQQPKARRFTKKDYRNKAKAFGARWRSVAAALSEARRFEAEFSEAVRRSRQA